VRRKQLKGLQFYRQRIIGNYIVNFYVPRAKLVIELDGGQHLDDDNQEKDRIRNGYMDRIGLKVLRFSNKDVFNNIEGVLEVIYKHL